MDVSYRNVYLCLNQDMSGVLRTFKCIHTVYRNSILACSIVHTSFKIGLYGSSTLTFYLHFSERALVSMVDMVRLQCVMWKRRNDQTKVMCQPEPFKRWIKLYRTRRTNAILRSSQLPWYFFIILFKYNYCNSSLFKNVCMH